MQGPTLSQVKYQIVRLMRMLVEVTNTLEQVRNACFNRQKQSTLAASRSRMNFCLFLSFQCIPANLVYMFCCSTILACAQVPDERYLFMKMTYTDDTPEEYEPPMFGPAPDGGVGCFSRMPFIM
jgi:hypothetical protein